MEFRFGVVREIGWSADDGRPTVRRHPNPMAARYLKARCTVDDILFDTRNVGQEDMSRYEAKSPHIRHRRSCVRWRHAAALDGPASGVDRIHRNRRGRVWRSGSDVQRRTGYQEARERGVRRLPPSLPGIGEQRLVRRSCPRRREDAHGGVHVRDHAETCVGY